MRKYIAFLVLTLGALQGCISPFDVDVDEGAKKLVVNGLITNEPGPYTVKINKTTSYGGHFTDVNDDVLGATVTISDDSGVTETLKEVHEGEFRTSATGIQGRIGGSYTLRIKLKNGEEFVSEVEKLQPVPPIDRLYFVFRETTLIDTNRNDHYKPYFELRIDTKDPALEKNYYRWTSVGTYEVETQPEKFVIYDRLGNPISAPKECCRQCWVTKTDYSVEVASDRLFNGQSLIGKAVSTIPITPQFMGIKYHVALKQYSLSEKVYTFWKMLETQTVGTGSVQDPAPANARGNISKVNDPDEQVLGYFGASGVATRNIFLKRSDVPVPFPGFEFPDDCRVIPGSTTVRPSFWE
jgi:hypothetical protein